MCHNRNITNVFLSHVCLIWLCLKSLKMSIVNVECRDTFQLLIHTLCFDVDSITVKQQGMFDTNCLSYWACSLFVDSEVPEEWCAVAFDVITHVLVHRLSWSWCRLGVEFADLANGRNFRNRKYLSYHIRAHVTLRNTLGAII